MDLAPKENSERRRGVAEGVSVNLASRRSRRLDERDIHVEGDPDDLAAGMHWHQFTYICLGFLGLHGIWLNR